jgi:diguanylate cyclase (GGDEF)-like protein/PAS domain S-box-containing protein
MFANTYLRLAIINIGICGLYFLLGKAGQTVALAPGFVTILWPPSGLVIAACITWGWQRVIVGILLGAFVTNSLFDQGFNPSIMAAGVALGCALQAILGSRVVRRIHPSLEFDDASSIGRLVVVTAPICLIAATIGNLTLYANGIVTLGNLGQNFLTWWIGDVLGILIFLPLTLAFADQRPVWRRRRLQLGLPLLACLILCGLIFHFVQADDHKRLVKGFEQEMNSMLDSLNNLNDSNKRALDIMSGLAAAPGGLDPDTYLRNVTLVKSTFPKIHSFNWVPLVRLSDIKTFAANQSHRLGRGFAITPLPDQSFNKNGWTAPVALIEPLSGNESALGRDLLSEPLRAAAYKKAIATRRYTATAKITLVQDPQGPGGLLLNAPFQSKDGTVIGFITAVINLRDIFALITSYNNIQWILYDTAITSPIGGTLSSFPSFTDTSSIAHNGIYLQKEFSIFDRDFKIILFRSMDQLSIKGINSPYIIILMSLLTCAGITLFMLMLTGNAERTHREVALRTLQLRKSEDRFTLIATNVDEVFWMSNSQRTQYISPSYERIWGQSCQSLQEDPSSFSIPIHPDDRAQTTQSILAHQKAGLPYSMEFRLVSTNGQILWILHKGLPIKGADGAINHYAGTCTDITTTKQAQTDLFELNMNLEALVRKKTAEVRLAATVIEHTGEGAVVTDPDAIILSVNPAFCTITGYEPAEVIGKKISLLRSFQHNMAFYQSLWSDLKQNGCWQGEIWNRRKDGTLFLERQSINAVKDSAGITTHYVSVFNDITESRSKDDRIRHMAYHDALTGLPNRLLLEDRLEQGITVAKRENCRLGVLFIDLDRFKEVNDNLGHHIGDALLEQSAKRIKSCIRAADTLARLGGDEFVVLMSNLDNIEDCALLAQKIICIIGEPVYVNEHCIHVGASVGIAVYPDDGTSNIALMKCADTAMYAAKKAGRGCYSLFQMSMSEHSARRMKTQDCLRQAIANNEFTLHYQAKVHARSRDICGYEALLRWNNHQMGQISPVDFIPIAEDMGLIVDIGAWVIDEVCRQIAAWQKAGEGLKKVSINVSPLQLHGNVFSDQITQSIQRHNIPSSHLEIEITESAVMINPDEATKVFMVLRDIGVRIAIDDFGTGYSSLAYLRRLPIDILKIDRSFVMDADKNADDAEIVTLILALGKALRLEVVAEGVETEDQARLLEENGCDILQGFLFSHPAAAEHRVPATV